MASKIKNIIIFVVIAGALILAYTFFFKNAPEEGGLVSSLKLISPNANIPEGESPIGSDFLGVLLNVKNIKLNDSIFSDSAFLTLRDSSILLVQDGTEGRPNPFAPIGFELSASVVNTQTASQTNTGAQTTIQSSQDANSAEADSVTN